MSAVAEQTGAWLAEFTAQAAAEPWMQRLREGGFRRFVELGFPTTHNEEWRFTNVAAIARASFAYAPAVARVSGAPANAPAAVAETYLGQVASIRGNAFVALNTAFLGNVVVVQVPRGAVLTTPIGIDYTGSDGTHSAPRILIVVGADAHCTVVENYAGTGRYFTNAVTEIVAGDGAVVDHYKVQREDVAAYHISTLQARLGRSTNFSTHSISLGAAIARNDVNVVLAEGADATVNGLYIVNGTQHVDHHTVIDHAKPHGTSHELYKGILDGRSGAVFNGRIIVRKDAQKTDSKQTNKNLVLSENAVVNTKPELQIHADDVRCTHGATIGQLDAESLFYMQSRGIGKQQARSLLTYAFARDVIDRVQVPSLREQLEKVLFEKFHEHAR